MSAWRVAAAFATAGAITAVGWTLALQGAMMATYYSAIKYALDDPPDLRGLRGQR